MIRPTPTNNDLFGLRVRADRAGNRALVERVDRYLEERGQADLDVILGILDAEKQSAPSV